MSGRVTLADVTDPVPPHSEPQQSEPQQSEAQHSEPQHAAPALSKPHPVPPAFSNQRSWSGRHRVAVLALILFTVLGVAGSGRIAWVATQPVGAEVQRQQQRYLQRALDDGAAEQMQTTFPEGFVFTQALIGLAAAQSAEPGDTSALAAVRRAEQGLDSPAGTGRFAGQSRPVNGVFWAGWSLLLAVERARLSGTATDAQDVRARAQPLLAALTADPDGFLESYPGRVWPVDNVVAVAALARANTLVRIPGAAATVAAWPARTARVRSAGTRLLPHELNPDGTVAEGPRGSSQALLLAFEPDIDPALAAADYRSFVDTFVVRRVGLVGVREFPPGTDNRGDEDSGPLLFGVSATASAVALAAALRQQDRPLVRALNAEAELLGVPVVRDGARRYGGGLLPVGDAFLAWARAQPPAAGATGDLKEPQPHWVLWGFVPLFPALMMGLVIGIRTRRRAVDPAEASSSEE
jgi:hypothetical protein